MNRPTHLKRLISTYRDSMDNNYENDPTRNSAVDSSDVSGSIGIHINDSDDSSSEEYEKLNRIDKSLVDKPLKGVKPHDSLLSGTPSTITHDTAHSPSDISFNTQPNSLSLVPQVPQSKYDSHSPIDYSDYDLDLDQSELTITDRTNLTHDFVFSDGSISNSSKSPNIDYIDNDTEPSSRFSRTIGLLMGVLAAMISGIQTVFLGKSNDFAPLSDTTIPEFATALAGTYTYELCACVWSCLCILCMLLLGQSSSLFSSLSLSAVLWTMAAGICASVIGFLCFFIAVNNISSYAAGIVAMYPVFGSVLSFLVFRDRIFPLGWMGLCLTVLGTVGISLIAALYEKNVVKNAVIGIVFSLSVVVSWGVECTILDYAFRRYRVHSLTAYWIREVTSVGLYSLVIVPLYSLYSLSSTDSHVSIWRLVWEVVQSPSIIYLTLGGLGGVSSCVAYYIAIDTIQAIQAMSLNTLFTIFTVIFGLPFGIQPSNIPTVLACMGVISIGSVFCAGLGKEEHPWLVFKSWWVTLNEEDALLLANAQRQYQRDAMSRQKEIK